MKPASTTPPVWKYTGKPNDAAARAWKYTGKPSGDKLTCGGNLYLLVRAAGKYWRWDYVHLGKRLTLSLGVYPAVSWVQAVKKRDDAREVLDAGGHPGLAKEASKTAKVVASANTFAAVALEYWENKRDGWSPSYGEKWKRGMEKDLFPYIGRLPISAITAQILKAPLLIVEGRGARETAHTLKQNSGQVFRYGVHTGRCERDVAADLKDALKPAIEKNHAAILDPVKVGELLRAIDGYSGQPTTRAALALSALLFQRPGNIRQMEWTWVDFDAAMLTVPSPDMKRRKDAKINGRPHLIPLAPQALALLRQLQLLTGHGRFVFSSLRTGARPMSENTVNAALRRMGFSSDEMTGHGFRSTAKTVMLERIKGINPEVIRAQMAHSKSDPLGSAYDRAEYIEQRREIMATWADYLDKLRNGADVIQFKAA